MGGSLWLIPNGQLQLSLPTYIAPQDGSDLLWAIVPALLGACAGIVLRLSRPYITHALNQLGGPKVQTLVGSAVFAVLAMAVPLVRFSGHHELVHLLEYGVEVGWLALLGLGLLKALALALCLSSGWRGGENFPTAVCGCRFKPCRGRNALAKHAGNRCLDRGHDCGCYAGMGKPIAVLLIMLLLTGASAPGALFIGILAGYGRCVYCHRIIDARSVVWFYDHSNACSMVSNSSCSANHCSSSSAICFIGDCVYYSELWNLFDIARTKLGGCG